jgi:hypothetical protein
MRVQSAMICLTACVIQAKSPILSSTTRNTHQTPILHCALFQRDPTPNRARWVRVKKCRVIVDRHLAADAWLLANHHALQHPRAFVCAQVPRQFAYPRVLERVSPKYRIEDGKAVADLVHGLLGRDKKLRGRVGGGRGQGRGLEKVPDLVAGFKKVRVAYVLAVGGGGKARLRVSDQRCDSVPVDVWRRQIPRAAAGPYPACLQSRCR